MAALKHLENATDAIRTSLDKPGEIEALRQLPPDIQQELIARAKTGEKVSAKTRLKQVKRNARELALGTRQLAYPSKLYGVIVCDDEWDYEPWSEDRVKLPLIVALLNQQLNPKDGRCRFVKDDGGRARSGIACGHKGDDTRDCVARAIAIATEKPYRSDWPRAGPFPSRVPYLESLGWRYTSTRELPSGQ
jgi:hypothetical protein